MLAFSADVSATESASQAGGNHAFHPYHNLISTVTSERLLLFPGDVSCHIGCSVVQRRRTAVEATRGQLAGWFKVPMQPLVLSSARTWCVRLRPAFASNRVHPRQQRYIVHVSPDPVGSPAGGVSKRRRQAPGNQGRLGEDFPRLGLVWLSRPCIFVVVVGCETP